MTASTPTKLADAWIKEFVGCDVKPISAGGDAYRALNRLCDQEPEAALEVIVQVCERTDAPEVLSVLAAGPLENILVKFGDRLIKQVLKQAQISPSFGELLKGLWPGRIAPDCWARIERARHGEHDRDE